LQKENQPREKLQKENQPRKEKDKKFSLVLKDSYLRTEVNL